MTMSEQEQQRTLDITARAEQKYAQIRANDSLSTVARQRAVAAVYRSTRDELKAMRTTLENQRTMRIRDLQRQTFGVQGNDPLARMDYRDAVSRASAFDLGDEGKAAYELRRAMEAGDEAGARALAERASEMGWRDVLEAYVTENPSSGQALNEIAALSQPLGIVEEFHYLAVKPTEINNFEDFQINELAEQAG